MRACPQKNQEQQQTDGLTGGIEEEVARPMSHIKPPTFSTLVKQLLNESGPSALYRGLSAKLILKFVRNFLFFYCYAYNTSVFKTIFKTNSLSFVLNIGVAYVSALMNIVTCTPIEVVATRTMVSADGGVWAIIRKTWQEGPGSFYKGTAQDNISLLGSNWESQILFFCA